MFDKNTYKIFAKNLDCEEINSLGLSINEKKLVFKIKEIYARFKDNLQLAEEIIKHTYNFWLIKVNKGC